MSLIDPTPLELAQARLTAYQKAQASIIGGAQEYTIGSGATARRLTRANLAEVNDAIKAVQDEIVGLTAAPAARRGRVAYLRPL